MAGPTYSLHAIVLRKTKLGESDLILTLLAEDGRQVRAVAKGARKPNSPFSSRLEIFAEVEALMASGKSLDIVKEVRLVDAHQGIVFDAQHAAACAPVVDLASRLTQPDLASPKMFALLSSALGHACSCNAEEALAVCAAFMLKAFSFAGFRPCFDCCVGCGISMPLSCTETARDTVLFSAAEGGVVCSRCLLFSDAQRIPVEVLSWAHFLLMSTFDDVVASKPPCRVIFEILHLCQSWVREHVGSRLKSLDFLFVSGLF